MYELETKKYFSIKCPLFNQYKDMKNTTSGTYFGIAAFLSKTKESAVPFSAIEAIFSNQLKTKWFERNKEQLINMNKTAKSLKEMDDHYIYAEAFIYTNGLIAQVLPYKSASSADIFMLSNFALDFPNEKNDQALKEFGQKGLELYINYIPKTFTIWPDILSDKDISKEEKAQYSHNACVLFDYILQRATYSVLNSTDADFIKFIKTQVLCYYKWLCDKKIYLPKSIQERLYEFSLFEY